MRVCVLKGMSCVLRGCVMLSTCRGSTAAARA